MKVRDQVIYLSSENLTSQYEAIKSEIRRRTMIDVDGHDPASIIRGHEMVKRAVLIAAAGQHSLLLVGQPKVGKTMLRALALALGLSETFEAWPCPCGFRNSLIKECTCSSKQIQKHINTSPQTEMTVEVSLVPERELNGQWPGTSLAELQQAFASRIFHPAYDMDDCARDILKASVTELGVDRHAIIRIARTIANLDRSHIICAQHITEAVNYRYS